MAKVSVECLTDPRDIGSKVPLPNGIICGARCNIEAPDLCLQLSLYRVADRNLFPQLSITRCELRAQVTGPARGRSDENGSEYDRDSMGLPYRKSPTPMRIKCFLAHFIAEENHSADKVRAEFTEPAQPV